MPHGAIEHNEWYTIAMYSETKIGAFFEGLLYVMSAVGFFFFAYHQSQSERTHQNMVLIRPWQEKVYDNQKDIYEENVKKHGLAGTVTKVVDGDTIKVQLTDGKTVTVRLLGIDAPEMRNSPKAEVRGKADCFANEATNTLRTMAQDKRAILETDSSGTQYDKYGRLLAYVWVGDTNVNQEMISEGYAYEYTYRGRKYAYKDEFKNAQRQARENRRGLWADGVCE